MIPITPEMITAGVKIVSGIVTSIVGFATKLQDAKNSKIEYIAKEAAAAEKIMLAYTEEYKTTFNSIATGTEAAAFNFIQSLPAMQTDGTKDFGKLGGSTTGISYIVRFENNSINLVRKEVSATGTKETIKARIDNVGSTTIYKEQIRLPLVWVENKMKSSPLRAEYLESSAFFASGTRMQPATVKKWIDGTTTATGTTAGTTTATYTPDAVKDGKKSSTAFVVGGAVVILGILAYFITKK